MGNAVLQAVAAICQKHHITALDPFLESCRAAFQNGKREPVPLGRISAFISEAENPENIKRVAGVRVELPIMA